MMTLVRLTDVQGIEHSVTDEAMVLGRITGYYVTLCGWTVEGSSLTAPPGRSCRRCLESTLA